jgi:iron complex outermembrane receptor protein
MAVIFMLTTTHVSRRPCPRSRNKAGTVVAASLLLGLRALAGSFESESPPTLGTPQALKKLSLEELMDLEVTSVSKRPEKLSETASAIQVVTGEDIRRSGATSLVEALQLAPNVRVAQLNSYGWVVTTRGFSGLFANKLLVMIDGRTVYTPLFAGVLWDVQNPLLEDIDRIEVVSGPGGTLWGANAVNGVINVVTRSARDTQGLYVGGAAGSQLENWGGVRYGGQAGRNLYYRVYLQRTERDSSLLPGGADATDDWEIAQGGLRMDWYPNGADTWTFQGDAYGGTEHTRPAASKLDGGNAMGRWTRTLSPDSEFSVQAFFDRTWRRDVPSTLTDKLQTYDLDFQHRFVPAARHELVWGGDYRLMQSEVLNSTSFVGFVPPSRRMELFSGFVQDEIVLVPDRWRFIAGTKLEHNVFSGFEIQPNVRLAWSPGEDATVWAAVSRAVRSPSRIDVDYHIPAFDIAPGSPGVDGGPDFGSEHMIAWELGARWKTADRLTLSVSAFFNRYDDLYSVEALPGTPTYQIQNGTEGDSSGLELAGTWQATPWWRLRGGYTYFHKALHSKPGRTFDSSSLGNDPPHQAVLQSMLSLPGGLECDVVARYTDALPNPAIPAFTTFDVRLAWAWNETEFSVVGQNLGDDRHQEFGDQLIPRGVFGRIVWRH